MNIHDKIAQELARYDNPMVARVMGVLCPYFPNLQNYIVHNDYVLFIHKVFDMISCLYSQKLSIGNSGRKFERSNTKMQYALSLDGRKYIITEMGLEINSPLQR